MEYDGLSTLVNPCTPLQNLALKIVQRSERMLVNVSIRACIGSGYCC